MPRNRKVSTASARYAVAHVVIEVHAPLSRSNTARIVSHRIVPAADILSPHYTILHTHARTHAHTTHTHARTHAHSDHADGTWGFTRGSIPQHGVGTSLSSGFMAAVKITLLILQVQAPSRQDQSYRRGLISGLTMGLIAAATAAPSSGMQLESIPRPCLQNVACKW